MFGIDFDKIKEWVAENKFLSIIIGISAVLVVLFGFLIFKNYSSRSELKGKVVKESDAIKKLEKQYGSLSRNNEKDLGKQVNQTELNSMAFYEKLKKPGVKKLNASRSASDFNSLLQQYKASSSKILSDGKIVHDDQSYFGFGKYNASSIKENPKAIGIALLQQDFFTWMFKGLAEVGNCELIHLYRETQPEENENRTVENPNSPISRSYRFDLVLKMTEPQFSAFFSKLNNSDEYLVELRHITIQNEKSSPAARPKMMEDTVVEEPSDVDDEFDFGGESIEEGVTGDTKKRKYATIPEKGDRILIPVLGDEKITIAASFGLVLLEDVDKLQKQADKTSKKGNNKKSK